MSFSVLFLLVSWISMMPHQCCSALSEGLCRRLKFSTKIDEYALQFHVIKRFDLSIYVGPSVRSACTHRCIMDPVCVSVNIGPPTDEKFICELSDSDHTKHPGDLKKREGFLYIGTENPCFSNPCLHDSICLNGYTDKQYLCECQAGYTGEQCEKDINECAIETDNCSLHAICNNTEGSFICSCRNGFSGDGINCTDINECTIKTDNCSVHAICNNTEGSFNCSCKNGFSGDGINCADINECAVETDNCSLHAICNNTEGSFICSCRNGFSGDGINCTDINECTIKTDNCSVHAICNNTEGSFNCSCKNGFSGDGINCAVFSAVFTNLGASGRTGPTTLGGHYTGQDHDGQVTLSSGIQQWTVPYTGDYRIEAVGAAGGYDTTNNSAQYRGRGARMIGTFSLSKGESIKILVGQEGGNNNRGTSSGGGGGTFVVRGSSTPLIIAGGGGGVAKVYSRHSGCDASTSTTGNPGHKSWSGGSNGHGADTSDGRYYSGGGGGGFYSSGRSGKNFNGTEGNGGEGGKGFLQGGVGGRAHIVLNNVVGGFGGGGSAHGGGGGGGGGGGYSGGSSGDNKVDSCGGGGGSYNAGTNRQNDCCYEAVGHGRVTITFQNNK